MSKDSTRENNIKGSVSFYSEQGSRNYQEDRFVAEHIGSAALHVLAVMDGHGDAGVAQTAADQLVPAISESYREIQEPTKNITSVLKAAVIKLDEATRRTASGSTLSIVAIPDGESKAYVAILGDSPVIISDAEGKINISPEHNVRTNLAERQKAIAKGAFYDRYGYIGASDSGTGMLQMSRVLGDSDLNSILDRTPETYKVDLGNESFVIVATDGVLDPSHRSDLREQSEFLADMVENGADAEALVHNAIAAGGTDNATAIVWRANKT